MRVSVPGLFFAESAAGEELDQLALAVPAPVARVRVLGGLHETTWFRRAAPALSGLLLYECAVVRILLVDPA